MASGPGRAQRCGAMWIRAAARVALGALLLAATGRAWALDPALQPTQYVRENWQITEGMPQNTAQTIARTPDGYLWIGTQEGLARFDGVRFTVYDSGNEPAIPNKHITVLHVDRHGRLWVGTRAGLAVLEGGRFRTYDGAAALAQARVRSIVEDRAGRVWIGTETGLVGIDGGQARVYGAGSGLRDSPVRALLADRGGRLWVATATAGLFRSDRDTFTPVSLGPDAGSDAVSAMDEDADGTLWFGTGTGALYRRRGETMTAVAPRRR